MWHIHPHFYCIGNCLKIDLAILYYLKYGLKCDGREIVIERFRLFIRRTDLKKKKMVEIHKFTVIEPLEEIYPETKRKLIRPQVNIKRAILLLFFVIIGIGLISLGILKIASSFEWYQTISLPWMIQFILLYIVGLLLSLLLFLKRIIIFFIRLYQKYGPYEIRSRCLFVPNCSEYMILAIQKYGVIKGIKKGIDRFHRCHAPNGGEDYP